MLRPTNAEMIHIFAGATRIAGVSTVEPRNKNAVRNPLGAMDPFYGLPVELKFLAQLRMEFF